MWSPARDRTSAATSNPRRRPTQGHRPARARWRHLLSSNQDAAPSSASASSTRAMRTASCSAGIASTLAMSSRRTASISSGRSASGEPWSVAFCMRRAATTAAVAAAASTPAGLRGSAAPIRGRIRAAVLPPIAAARMRPRRIASSVGAALASSTAIFVASSLTVRPSAWAIFARVLGDRPRSPCSTLIKKTRLIPAAFASSFLLSPADSRSCLIASPVAVVTSPPYPGACINRVPVGGLY